MPVEVDAFKTLVRTWLTGIDGMSAHIAARCYCGRPMETPTFPLIAFGLGRRPQGDFPHCAWEGDLRISIYSAGAGELGAIEDLILDWLARNGLEVALTDASVKCNYCGLTEVEEDVAVVSMEEESYVQTVRTLRFVYSITSLET